MNRFIACSTLVLVSGLWSAAFAQEATTKTTSKGGPPALTGQVAYENPDAPARNNQLEALEELDVWSSRLESIIKGSGEGIAPDLKQNAISYLSVLYLYCSVKQGPCPFILEMILDDDIARSRSEKNARCPVMNRFFKSYISQSLDERGKFLFSLREGLEIAKFNSEERPRFVECKETVSAIITDKDVLDQRYGETGSSVNSAKAFRSLLTEIKEKKVDIYGATGVKTSS
jgi:hypothetical protein